jgi:hypothetical protein
MPLGPGLSTRSIHYGRHRRCGGDRDRDGRDHLEACALFREPFSNSSLKVTDLPAVTRVAAPRSIPAIGMNSRPDAGAL